MLTLRDWKRTHSVTLERDDFSARVYIVLKTHRSEPETPEERRGLYQAYTTARFDTMEAADLKAFEQIIWEAAGGLGECSGVWYSEWPPGTVEAMVEEIFLEADEARRNAIKDWRHRSHLSIHGDTRLILQADPHRRGWFSFKSYDLREPTQVDDLGDYIFESTGYRLEPLDIVAAVS